MTTCVIFVAMRSWKSPIKFMNGWTQTHSFLKRLACAWRREKARGAELLRQVSMLYSYLQIALYAKEKMAPCYGLT